MNRMLGFVVVLSLCVCAVPAAEPQVVFQDGFQGKLGDGWTWLREHKEFWRIKDGALEIHVEPGVATTVQNALLRKAPDRSQGKFAIEVTITNLSKPKQQFEQAGITWYRDGKPLFKFVKERVDGELYMIPGKKPMAADSVQMRLVVTADKWIGQYRPDGKGEFLTAAEGNMPPPGDDQVSIQCYHGPTDAEHWIRFDDFRILKLAE